MTYKTILITGVTGYIARHIAVQALNAGYTVIGSTRDLTREGDLRAALADHLSDPAAQERFKLIALDNLSDDGWAEAFVGVNALIHTASPVPVRQPKDADDLIRPARDGALRAAKAAYAAGVRRMVMTSSIAAVDNGWGKSGPGTYDETSWTTMTGPEPVPPYSQSKTYAEKAAWDYVREEGDGLELAVIRPTLSSRSE